MGEGAEGKGQGFSLPPTALPLTPHWQKRGHMATPAAREAGKGSSIPAAALLLVLWLCLVTLRRLAPGPRSTEHLRGLSLAAAQSLCQVRAAALPLIPEAQLISGCNSQQTAIAEENDHVEEPC